ncbi:MAG: hypothetical protein WBZ36_28895, partial [Candidatus Nitrosopolaris sp.]
YQNDRANRGEISVSTIPNYYRATKLFCEMNDIVAGILKLIFSKKDRRVLGDRHRTDGYTFQRID